jgi:hypothetical protein
VIEVVLAIEMTTENDWVLVTVVKSPSVAVTLKVSGIEPAAT